MTFTADARYTFTGQYLEASAMFVRRAREIEISHSIAVSDQIWCEHRALISTTIMQCTAALETEAHEICTYGPGAYSNHTDHIAQQYLSPMADFIDNQSTLSRYDLILHLLEKPALAHNTNPYQSAALLVRLRNELVHYKSRWGAEMSSAKLFTALHQLQHKPAPFAAPSMNFFPHRCLSADCGAWALSSTIAFLEAIYSSLGVPSRFETYRQRLLP